MTQLSVRRVWCFAWLESHPCCSCHPKTRKRCVKIILAIHIIYFSPLCFRLIPRRNKKWSLNQYNLSIWGCKANLYFSKWSYIHSSILYQLEIYIANLWSSSENQKHQRVITISAPIFIIFRWKLIYCVQYSIWLIYQLMFYHILFDHVYFLLIT